MSDTQLKLDAIERVKNVQSKKARNFRVSETLEDFFGGTLVYVDYIEDGEELQNYVFYDRGAPAVYRDTDDVMRVVYQRQKDRNFYSLIKDTLSIGGVAGIIALIITFVLCYMALAGKQPIPEVLTNALTTIIGFYFGSQVAKNERYHNNAPNNSFNRSANSGAFMCKTCRL